MVKKVTSYKTKIFQINGVTTISIAGNRVTAIIKGNKITWRNSTASGTIVNNGNRINWADGGFWVKQIPPKKKPKTRTSNSPRQKTKRSTPKQRKPVPPTRTKPLPTQDPVPPKTSLEQRCFNMIQGKVAWRKNESKRWTVNNVRNFCSGTKNPSALVNCFKSQTNQNKNWTTAKDYCKGNSPTLTNIGRPVSTSNKMNLSAR